MNAVYAKEIRLLQPAFGMALLLAIVPVWLLPNVLDAVRISVVPFAFGLVMLGLSSFGREFALQTFSLLLAQPVKRRVLWRIKTLLLAAEMAAVFVAWWVSCEFFLTNNPRAFLFSDVYFAGAVCAVLAYCGGLWTTLLLRQVAAGFWFTILIPASIALILDEARTEFVLAALFIYAITTFSWARRYFLNAQEVGWTGGVVTIPSFRKSRPVTVERKFRPWVALCWKELQLHEVALFAMAWLFIFHLGVAELRRIESEKLSNTLRTALEVVAGIWIVIPLLASCVSVAEERKLGTLAAQLCQPTSRQLQFGIKLLVTVFIGGFLSAFGLCAVEAISALQGAGNLFTADFKAEDLLSPFLVFMGVAFVGFYASTLARNVVQAFAAAVVSITALAVLAGLALDESTTSWLWRGHLVIWIGAPSLFLTLLVLAWKNFRSESGSDHLWFRNVLVLCAVVAGITIVTSTLYNRAWEFLTPLEAQPGQARITGAQPVAFSDNGGAALTAILPNGTLWINRVVFESLPTAASEGHAWLELPGQLVNFAASKFVPGSNWVAAVATWREFLGIQSDGTLWVSKESGGDPLKLVRFGSESNWQATVSEHFGLSVLLLKSDGTLWRLGTNSFGARQKWPGFQAFTPTPLLADASWDRLLSSAGVIYGWKKDGTAWWIHASSGKDEVVAEPCHPLDHARWRSLAQIEGRLQVGVREDGTLWYWGLPSAAMRSAAAQIGTAGNWINIASDLHLLVALKKDGSLWHWDSHFQILEFKQIGTRKDWVGATPFFGGTLSLAADGNLYFWQNGPDYSILPSLLAPPRKPQFVENIFPVH